MGNGFKFALGCGGLLIIGVLIFGGMFIGAKNKLVAMNEEVDAKYAQVDNVLKRRNDLIPNLVNTVKGYASHEKEIFIQIAEARSKLAGATNVQEKVDANNSISSALSRLLVIVERYPDLKADKQFINLQYELAGTENRIAVERERFNESVKTYNIYVKGFPGSFFAGLFKYQPRTMLETPQAEKEVPKVDFGTSK
ncbi:MAG: LemA family protein [bacterium]